MQRTIRLRLEPTHEQADALLETLRQHTECFNAVCAYGWSHKEKNGVRLHHATYRQLRVRFPALPAQMVIAARKRACEALKSAFTNAKRGKEVSQPQSHLCPIRYDARTYTLRSTVHGRSPSQEGIVRAEGQVSLASVVGRLKIPFAIDSYAQSILGQAAGFDSADLIYRRGQFWLHVVVTLPDVAFQPSEDVIGIDLGITRPAVSSHNRFFGERRWKEINERYFRLRRSLQRKGTRSAKRHLRRLSGKVKRFRRDCDHVLSKRILDSVPTGSVIVLEKLPHIRNNAKAKRWSKKSRRKLHSWSFHQLREFLTYKAEAKGCRIEEVDPRYTSQTCSRCGYVHRSNRRSQSRFRCRTCGFELNADLNAARNIARKYLASGGRSAAGGPMSTGLSCQPYYGLGASP